jgi:hypothetical protein
VKVNHWVRIFFPATVGAVSLACGLLAGPANLPTQDQTAAANQDRSGAAGDDLETILAETMRPFAGTNNARVDTATMQGKVMCGYQGWFATEGDGLGRGWFHWANRKGFQPGNCTIDLWPDVREFDADERFATPFVHADGSRAEVFSSYNRKTVLRHFKWMQDYGVDGVFVQRFAVELSHGKGLRQSTTVLGYCRDGANAHGRTYAVMYDLSGLGKGQVQLVKEDWKRLIDRMQITKDAAYQRHRGKPVVAVWGLGFSDRRSYTLDEGLDLVRFLKDDPQYGGCTVMLGVPTRWRTLDGDAVGDPQLHDVISKADIVSPWTVGRYATPEQATQYAQQRLKGDLEWCREHGKELMPVVFPGFSWHNMNSGAPLNQIPRLKGKFLWTQFVQARKAGATMVYQAMFDEVNEGTAIFKCTDDPPVGASSFVTYEGLPSDFYLKMLGEASKLFRSDLPAQEAALP